MAFMQAQRKALFFRGHLFFDQFKLLPHKGIFNKAILIGI